MKKIFLFLLVLCAVVLASCNDKVETIPPNDDNGQTNQPGGENNPDGGSTEEVTIIKGEDSFSLEVEESKEIDLGTYFKYSGTKYFYLVETEGKDVVETEILNSTLTVYAVHNGVEVVTVTLNDKKVEITFTVTGELIMPEFADVDVEYDVAVSDSVTVTLAPTVSNGHENFSYSLKTPTDGVTIDGNSLTVSIEKDCEKTVAVVCTFGNNLSVEFNLNIKVSNSKNVVNGSFDKGLEGWTLSGEIGAVTENSVFWDQEFPMNNVGKYFDGHAGVESNKGTLTSSLFELGGNGYITFMLGGAANPECLVKVVDKDGNILAIYRNTEFRDMKDEHHSLSFEQQRELIGTEINVCNLVKYKADLSEHIGKEIQIVIVDNAENNFGLVFFDELNCYYTEAVGDDYVLATNQLADLTAVNELIANKVNEQGDYTLDSFNNYSEKVNAAIEAINNPYITQARVNELVNAINEAYTGLTLREITTKDAELNKTIITGNTLEISYNDYFDTADLSSVTFEYESSLTLSVVDGVLTLDTTSVEINAYTITLKALYKGELKQSVTLTIDVIAEPTVTVKKAEVSYNVDLYKDGNGLTVDLLDNIVIVGGLEVKYIVDGEETDSLMEVTLTEGRHELNVVVKYTYITEQEVSYKVVFNVIDTTKYHVVNGTFDKDLEGWVLEGEEFAAISENRVFWGEQYPMNNVGKYFDGYGKNDLEVNRGTLTSSLFTLGGNGYITFMLGGAGNPDCLVKVVDKDGNILAIYRNTEFRDFTSTHNETLTVEQKRELIGSEVNLANLVKYKADLTDYIGQEIRIVLVDNATSGWGVMYFDELHTYYTAEIGDDYVLAINQLADLTAVNELIANKVNEQGDYTSDSFNIYVERINEAIEAINNPYITSARVNELVNAINEAYTGLTLREITVKEADKNYKVTVGESLVINYADYFDTKDLSSVTFAYESSLTLSELNGSLTFNSIGVALEHYVVMLKALYKGEVKQTVELTVEVTEDKTPVLREETVTLSQDKYFYDKEQFEFDLASNVINSANLELTYYVNHVAVEGSIYTLEFDNNTHELLVEVHFTIDEEEGYIEYLINAPLFDSTPNRLLNGDFETGDLDGWTLVGKLGNVSNNTNYWLNDPESAEGFPYHKDGKYLFDAYNGGVEAAVGTLTSSSFIVGGSGYVTFKLGAMRDGNYVYVDVVDAYTKEIVARYYNGLWSERTEDRKSGCTLIAYKANLSEFMGRELFFRLSDNADSGYGLFFVDSFITYYETEPEGFNVATPVDYEVSGTIYDVFNGGFEMGGNQGWWNIGEPGAVTSAEAFFSGVAYGKEGNFLYSGVEDHLAGNGREGNKGTLTSSVFEIGGIGYISFMLGGGGNDLCYVQVIDAVTNEVLVRYHQQAMEDAVLKTYVADLSAFIGRTARIQVVDYAENNWGCVSFDNVVTYYKSNDALPNGITANNIFAGVHNVTNGSFENGLDGWHMNITEAGAHNTLGWVESAEINEGWYTKNDDRKDGNNLFTFARGTENCENTKGNLNSSFFTLTKDSYVAFRFGGAGTRDVHVQLVRVDGAVIATFFNEAPGKINTEMHAYYYQYTGETADCFFRVVDNSVSNYGCFVVDDFRANLSSAPEGFIEAIR